MDGHPSTNRMQTTNIHIANANLWTAETPFLYSLHITFVEDGQTVQTHDEKIGLREISTVGGVFRINGQAVKLCGANHHDE